MFRKNDSIINDLKNSFTSDQVNECVKISVFPWSLVTVWELIISSETNRIWDVIESISGWTKVLGKMEWKLEKECENKFRMQSSHWWGKHFQFETFWNAEQFTIVKVRHFGETARSGRKQHIWTSICTLYPGQYYSCKKTSVYISQTDGDDETLIL